MGKKRATVANYLRLLKLPAEMQIAIRNRKISMGHARAIINIDSEADQKHLFHQIVEEGLSVRQVEDTVRSISTMREVESVMQNKNNADETSPENSVDTGNVAGELPDNTHLKKKLPGEIMDYSKFQKQMHNNFNVKVEVKRNNNGAGKIVIPFNSDDELARIISALESK